MNVAAIFLSSLILLFFPSHICAGTPLRFIDQISSADIHNPYSKKISYGLWEKLAWEMVELPQLDTSRFERRFTFDKMPLKRLRLLQKEGLTRVVDYYPPAAEGIISCKVSLDKNSVGGLVLARSARNYRIIALGRKNYNFLLMGGVEKKHCRWDYLKSLPQIRAGGDLQLTVVFKGPVLAVFVNEEIAYISTDRTENESYRVGTVKLLDSDDNSGARISEIRHKKKVDDEFLDVSFLIWAHLQGAMQNEQADEYASGPAGDLIYRPGIGEEYRTALLFPPSTKITFPVEIPSEATLEFGLGARSFTQSAGSGRQVANAGAVGQPLRQLAIEALKDNYFQVDLIGEEGEVINLFSRTVSPDLAQGWQNIRVDLASYAGFQGKIAWEWRIKKSAIPQEILFLANPTLTSAYSPGKKPPNVVLYVIDSLRADKLGCYGNPLKITPEIDRWAENAIRFSAGYAQAPWSLPSLSTMFTSRYKYAGHLLGDRPDLESPTLTEMLKKQGYATASFSENIITGRLSGLDRGFDYLNFKRVDPKYIREWIIRNRNSPFFLYVHIMDPHLRYWPPANFLPKGITAEKAEEVNKNILELTGPQPFSGNLQDLMEKAAAISQEIQQILPDIKRLYEGEVAVADYRFGKFIRLLKDLHLADDTLFILTSNHGEEFAEHGELLHGRSLYNSALHVPLILRMPGPARRGRVAGNPVGLIDIMPTVLNVAGRQPPVSGNRQPGTVSTAQGESLLPVILGNSEKKRRKIFAVRNSLQIHSPGRGKRNISVTEEKWKAIYNQDLETMELYDIISDPEELNDLAATYPNLIRIYKNLINQWLNHNN